MMIVTKPLTQITQEAIQILYREIGVVNTLRFLNQFTTGFGDYTAERDLLFADVGLDDVVADIKRARQHGQEAEDETGE